ncbi:MAG: FecR domain-containing protein, partial [Alphaproteobacteria bacterium]
MLDQSAVTVAPNSELVIDKFVYDPDKRTGEMAMTLSKGLMRFVGGRLSKSGGVQVNTPVATMGIRGGIALIHVVSPTVVDVTLLYGDAIEGVTDTGRNFRLRRTGFFTRIQQGKGASAPQPAPAGTVGQSMAKLEGRN